MLQYLTIVALYPQIGAFPPIRPLLTKPSLYTVVCYMRLHTFAIASVLAEYHFLGDDGKCRKIANR